jgi:hypothetical protein
MGDIGVSKDSLRNLIGLIGQFLGTTDSQTVTNKTFNTTDNTLTSTSQAAGDILKNDGTKFERLAKGTAGQPLKVNAAGTDLEYATLPVGGGGTGATSLTGILKGSGTSAIIAVAAPVGAIMGDSDTQNITGPKTWMNQTLKLRNPANTFTATIVNPAVTADTNITLPIGATVGADQENVFGDFNQTFRSGRLRISNPANTFFYSLTGTAVAADRILNLPLLTGTDTLVTEAHTQTLTNKTLTDPTINGTTLTVRKTDAAGNQTIEFGPNHATGGTAALDFHVISTDGDYSTRFLRNTGTAGRFDLIQNTNAGFKFSRVAALSTVGGGIDPLISLTETLQTTDADAQPYTGMLQTLDYRADDVSVPTDSAATATTIDCKYGVSAADRAVGNVAARAAQINIKGAGNILSEAVMDVGYISMNNGETLRAWYTDWNIQGSVNVQPGKLQGISMFINNYYNGSPLVSKSCAIAVVTGPSLGIIDAEHAAATTYKLDYGIAIQGFGGTTGAQTRGIEIALQIGSNNTTWLETLYNSKIGTGIRLTDIESIGVSLNDPATSASSPVGISVSTVTRTWDTFIDLSSGLAPTTSAIKLGSRDIRGTAAKFHEVAANLFRMTAIANTNMGLDMMPNIGTVASGVYRGYLRIHNTNSADLEYAEFAASGTTGYLLNVTKAASGSLRPLSLRMDSTAALTVNTDGTIGIGANARLKLVETGLTGVRTFTFPDTSSEVATIAATQTLTNKTINALASNTDFAWTLTGGAASAFSIRRTDTGIVGFEIGSSNATPAAVFIDFHTSNADGDYSSRIIRNSTAQGTLDFQQSAQGGFRFLRSTETTTIDDATSPLIEIRSFIQTTDATPPDYPTVKCTTHYRADDATDPLDLATTGLYTELYYGESAALPAAGSALARTTTCRIQGSGGTAPKSNEICNDMGWMSANDGAPGSFWYTDFNLHGPVAVQSGGIGGVNMFVGNYYSGASSRYLNYCYAANTKPDSGGGINAEHTGVTTYKLDYGFAVQGYAGTVASPARGFEVGVQVGGGGTAWCAPGQSSKIGTGIKLTDIESIGLDLNDPATSASSPVGIKVTTVTRTWDTFIDLSGGLAPTTATIKLGLDRNLFFSTVYMRDRGSGVLQLDGIAADTLAMFRLVPNFAAISSGAARSLIRLYSSTNISNGEFLDIQAAGTNGMVIDTTKAGTGTVRNLIIKTGGNNVLTFNGTTNAMEIADARDIVLGSTTGTKIGTATTQKLGFFNVTPVVQQAANANTSGATLAALETEVNELKATLRTFGFIAP